jgi:hypothetical protein
MSQHPSLSYVIHVHRGHRAVGRESLGYGGRDLTRDAEQGFEGEDEDEARGGALCSVVGEVLGPLLRSLSRGAQARSKFPVTRAPQRTGSSRVCPGFVQDGFVAEAVSARAHRARRRDPQVFTLQRLWVSPPFADQEMRCEYWVSQPAGLARRARILIREHARIADRHALRPAVKRCRAPRCGSP